MSTKRRKKKHTKNHLQKDNEAKLKNDFKRRLKIFFEALDCADLYPKIPKIDMILMYNYRMRSVKVVNGQDSNISNGILKFTTNYINRTIRNTKIKILDNGLEVSILELHTIGSAIDLAFGNERDQQINKGENFYLRLKKFIVWFKESNKIFDTFYSTTDNWCKALSNLNKGVFWFELTRTSPSLGRRPEVIIKLSFNKTQSRKVNINGHNRTVFEIAWGFTCNGLEFATFEPKSSELETKEISTPLQVYIQNHALTRLSERLGDGLIGIPHMDIYFTFQESKVYHYEDGKFYFDFLLLGKHKLGYLVGEIVEDILLIKTFLFLTNNGTPESKKLHQLTGFCKEDKKYLGIDKLSTFQNSDIKDNPKIKDLFIQAGCEALFNVDINLSLSQKYADNIASKFLHYFNTEQEEITNIQELEEAMAK